MRANGKSTGLKNKSLEACLETRMDAVEAQGQHLVPHVPEVRANKGEQAEAIKLPLLLSSFYSHLNVPRVSMFRRWFYQHNFSLILGSRVTVSEEKEEKGEQTSQVTSKWRDRRKEKASKWENRMEGAVPRRGEQRVMITRGTTLRSNWTTSGSVQGLLFSPCTS